MLPFNCNSFIIFHCTKVLVTEPPIGFPPDEHSLSHLRSALFLTRSKLQMHIYIGLSKVAIRVFESKHRARNYTCSTNAPYTWTVQIYYPGFDTGRECEACISVPILDSRCGSLIQTLSISSWIIFRVHCMK